jgi:hypothetical protein
MGGNMIFRSNGNAIYRNNKVIDSTGLMFYVGGGANLLEGNTVRPFMKYFGASFDAQTYGTMSIFELKGRSKWSAGDVLRNNHIENCAFVQPIDLQHKNIPLTIEGCTLQSSAWTEDLVATDTFIDESLCYVIRDLTNFQTLAGSGNYDAGLVAGDTIYFDLQEHIWKKFGKAMPTAFAVRRGNDTLDHQFPIVIRGNTIRATGIAIASSGNFKQFKVENNEIYHEGSLFDCANGSPIKKAFVRGNNFYKGSGSNTLTSTTDHVTDAIYENNTFHNSIPTILQISFKNSCDWINNRVVPWEKFANTTVFAQMPSNNNYSAVYFVAVGGGGTLNVKGGVMDSYLTRGGCMFVKGCTDVVVQGTKMRARNISEVALTTNRRVAMHFRGLTPGETISITNLTLRDIELDFENKTDRVLFSTDNTTTFNVTNLKLDNVRSNAVVLNKMMHNATGSMAVTNLTAVKSTDLVTDTAFTAIVTNRTIDQGVNALYEKSSVYNTQNFTIAATDVNCVYEFPGGGGTATIPAINAESHGRTFFIHNTTSGALNTSGTIYLNNSTGISQIAAAGRYKLWIDNTAGKIFCMPL